ncbi:MAG: ABC transporter substrate-binding protein [Alphaproteobacteria bacterium]|nr:ABC transporter substrate-binding protein [Alphaproteobacteria bacterium]
MSNEFMSGLSRRRAIAILGATALAAGFARRSALAGGTVAKFIEELGDRAILQLADTGISNGERESRFRALLRDSFDVTRISRFVLGRFVRKITKEQMAEFTLLYEDIAVLTYAHLFASYAGQGFKVKREVGDPGDRYKMVMTEIQPGNGRPPVLLDWQVKVNGDSYAVVDIRVEGASMAITQREEFTSVLERNGGDIADLLAQLRTKVDKLRADRSS